MSLTGPATGWQSHQVHTKVADPAGIAQSTPRTSRAQFVEWRWVTRTRSHGYGTRVDLRHVFVRLVVCYAVSLNFNQPARIDEAADRDESACGPDVAEQLP